MSKVRNAIIMAAGTSSRFAPLSYEKHKGLIEVKGEVLVERQIRQLRQAGIEEIIIVTGYKAEQFEYLKDKFGVMLVHNSEYLTRNNNSSIKAVKEYIGDSYICSVDNYFSTNPFETEVAESYYAAVYSDGKTQEWCMTEDAEGYINSVVIGGENAWYMLGHTFWDKEFTERFLKILDEIYDEPETRNLLWESIFEKHLDVLKMRIKKYSDDVIYEFDTLDELRIFDSSYVSDSRSNIIKDVSKRLGVNESEITQLISIKDNTNEAVGFEFVVKNCCYEYIYESKIINERRV
ncbi:MAG: NTP transferase domain-containing protein [Lachnospiraceae bacterium]|nr:NTP transferase domain-containing protein [Lachnospiraceae bacterium]